MEYNKDNADEIVLALLYLTTFEENGYGQRERKGMDWDVMNRLYSKGYIGNPKSKAKLVPLTEEGARLSEALFKKHFGVSS